MKQIYIGKIDSGRQTFCRDMVINFSLYLYCAVKGYMFESYCMRLCLVGWLVSLNQISFAFTACLLLAFFYYIGTVNSRRLKFGLYNAIPPHA